MSDPQTIRLAIVGIFVVTGFAIIIISIGLHELAHAAMGYALGGVAMPEGFGGGLLTLGRSWRRDADGRFRPARRMLLPHIRFNADLRTRPLLLTLTIGAGPAANLALMLGAFATAYAYAGLMPWQAPRLLRSLILYYIGVMPLYLGDAPHLPGRAIIGEFLLMIGSANVFGLLNLLPFRVGEGPESDGRQLLSCWRQWRNPDKF